MSSQISNPALKLVEKTEFLASSIRIHKPTVNASLAELPPEIFSDGSVEAPPTPDWNHLQDWNLAVLEVSAAEVRRTDQAHRENLVQLDKLRGDRDDRLDRLRLGHQALRRSFIGTYGRKSLPLVGLDGLPARAALAAREQLREIISRMRDPDLAQGLPEPLADQSPIDLERLAATREAEIDHYDKVGVELEQMRKRVVESRVRRMESRASNRRIYANVARIQEGLYRLADLDELAARIRLNTRSLSKRNEEPTEPQPDANEATPEQTEQKEGSTEQHVT